MKSSLFVVALTALVFSGCDKDDDDDQNNGNQNTTLLTQQTWRFDNAGFDADKNGTIELPLPAGTLQPCLTDNTATFTANGTGTIDEGPTKCDPALPQTTPFNWSFANGETMLNLSGSVIPGTNGGQFKINTLSSTQLSLSKDTVLLGQSIALVANFKH